MRACVFDLKCGLSLAAIWSLFWGELWSSGVSLLGRLFLLGFSVCGVLRDGPVYCASWAEQGVLRVGYRGAGLDDGVELRGEDIL